MMDDEELGRRLADRHRDEAELDPACSVLNYAEASYEGDWTLRSALMRLAQPHPVRVGSVLELARRLDGPLHQVRRVLERHVAVCDRALSIDSLIGPPIRPCGDIRTADLARLMVAGHDRTELLAGYEQQAALEEEERRALPLLALAVKFEHLAETVAAWGLVGPEDPPVEVVDRFVETAGAELDELGVPVETGPPPGMNRSRG
jgi:hypothetical protein